MHFVLFHSYKNNIHKKGILPALVETPSHRQAGATTGATHAEGVESGRECQQEWK